MTELKEIKIGDNEVTLNNNLVKSSILPKTAGELSRNIKIQGNVVIEGGVFGNHIEIENGDVTCESALYANSELHISNDAEGTMIFRKAVASADSVVALLTKARGIFGADINSVSIKLKNCIVCGSVFASEIYLEHCIVLGGVFATKQMTVRDCIIGTFHAPSVEIGGINYLLYPAAFSVEPISVLPQTELYNISLAHLGALFKGEPEAENTGKIKMNFEGDKQRTVLVGEDENTTIVNSYSVSGRVLAADMIDLEKLENHFLIGAAGLGSQILKVYSLVKEDGTRSEELTIQNIGEFFFQILDGKIQIQDISGEVSFADIRKNFE